MHEPTQYYRSLEYLRFFGTGTPNSFLSLIRLDGSRRHSSRRIFIDTEFFKIWTFDIPLYLLIKVVCFLIITLILGVSIIHVDSKELVRYESFICPVEGAFLFGTGLVGNCTYGVLKKKCTWEETVVLTKNGVIGVKIVSVFFLIYLTFLELFPLYGLFMYMLRIRRDKIKAQNNSDYDHFMARWKTENSKVQAFFHCEKSIEDPIKKVALMISFHYPVFVLAFVSFADVTGDFTCPISSQLTSFALENVVSCYLLFLCIFVVQKLPDCLMQKLSMVVKFIEQMLCFIIFYRASGILQSFSPQEVFHVPKSKMVTILFFFWVLPKVLRTAFDIDFKTNYKLGNDPTNPSTTPTYHTTPLPSTITTTSTTVVTINSSLNI